MISTRATQRAMAMAAVLFAVVVPFAHAQSSPTPGPDTAVARLVSELIRDSLSKWRSTGSEASRDSNAPARPGRDLLRAIDTTGFRSHAGAVGAWYPLGPGDVLVLSIWGQKQARYSLEIDRDGQVDVPAVGVVSLNGATFGSAEGILRRRLGSVYSGIQSGVTQFNLSLEKLRQVRVMILGDVERPGGYMLGGATSVMQAVAIAGGPTSRGSERLVQVSRGDTTLAIDLYAYLFQGQRLRQEMLRDGDILSIPPARGTALVKGGVARPGLYEVLPGETVASLLQVAGGASHLCDTTAQISLRTRSGNQMVTVQAGTLPEAIRTGYGYRVLSSDILEVPQISSARHASPVVSGSVRHPGSYPLTPGATARSLVATAGGVLPEAFRGRILVFRTDSTGRSTLFRTGLDAGPDILLHPTDSIVVMERWTPADSSRRAGITGAVRNPGTFPWAQGITVKDLVLLAGGFDDGADPTRIQIDEPSGDGLRIASRTVSLDTSLQLSSGDAIVPPDAVVSVPSLAGSAKLGFVVVAGQVGAQGAYSLRSHHDRISSLIARAGGVLDVGFAEGTTLIRRGERIPFNLRAAIKSPGSADDVALESGDSVFVPARPATVLVTGRVHAPRAVLWREGKSWEWYVQNAGGFTDSAAVKEVYVEYPDGSIHTRSSGIKSPGPGSVVTVPRMIPPPPATFMQKLSALNIIVGMLALGITTWILVESQK